MLTKHGLVRIIRHGFYVKGEGTYYPIDDLLKIYGKQRSQGLDEEIGFLEALVPSRECSKLTERYFGQAVSHTTCNKIATKAGDAGEKVEIRELKPFPKNTKKEEKRITFLVDGGRARTRIDKSPTKALKAINDIITRDSGKSFEQFNWRRKQEMTNELNPWRETKTWVITNGHDTLQWTTLDEGKIFMDDFCKEIKSKGYDTSVNKLSLNCDGAPWIGNNFEEHLPEIIQVLDEFHFSEHLFEVAKLLFKKKQDEYSWVSKCLNYCFEDKVASLILHVQNLKVENESKSDAHEGLRKLLGYIKNNRERIRYGYFRELGLPLGSGVVEGAIKKMNNTRVKGPSIRWRKNRLKKMLHLRSVVFNDQYDEIKIA